MFHYRNHVNHQDKAEHHESMSSLGLSINSFGAEYFFYFVPSAEYVYTGLCCI